ncbi:hypothetical protein BASA81_015169 [Batrachochytrium salamandrivorans]|nr:hypothetical protein BASA81_015169 [Batrachochytrium salamandrivorans]
MFQRGGITTAASKPETLAISQDHGQVSIALPDGTKLTLSKDNCQLQIGSNPLDLQKIADLSAALAASKLEYAKLSQELVAVQREKQQLQEELKKRPGTNGGVVVGFKPMTVVTSPPVVAVAAPPTVAVEEDSKPVLTSPMHVKREIAKASDVTEDNVIKHLAAGFDPNRLVGSDSPQNAKYGAASLLFWAAYGGQDKTIELLIKAGAKPDFKSKTGETALEVCTRKQRSEECIQLLKAAPLPRAGVPGTTGFVRGTAPGITPSGFVRNAAPTAPAAVVRPTTSYSSSYVRPTGTFLPPSNGNAAQPPSPSTPLTPSTPIVGVAMASPTTPLTAAPAAVVAVESPIAATATVETAEEPAAEAPVEVIAPVPAVVEEAPSRPLTFMEKRRLSTSAPPIITGALDVGALRSGLRPAPARVIAPKPEPEPVPVPVPVEGAPPVRVNKLADRMKMFERKT